MKHGFRTCILILLATVIVPTLLSAQTPYVVARFSDGSLSKDCPGFGRIDTLSIYAHNFPTPITGIEYRIEFPPAMSWFADFTGGQFPKRIGSSPTGVSLAWQIPRDASHFLLVQRILVQWTCGGCSGFEDQQIVVGPHPIFGFVRATDANFQFINGLGLNSTVCPRTLATEQSTWGKIKELYRE